MRIRAANRTTTTTPMAMNSAVMRLWSCRPASGHAGPLSAICSVWRSTFWLTTWEEPPGAMVTP